MDETGDQTDERRSVSTISRSLSILTTNSSCSSTSSSTFCRICHQNTDSDLQCDLVSPCNCSGTMANVHRQCLQRWASIASSSVCDICGYYYRSRVQFPSLFKWLKTVMTDSRHRIECVVLVLLGFTTPMIVFATVLSSIAGRDHSIVRPLLAVLMVITVMSWILYTVMALWSVRFLYQSFNSWRKKNQSVELIWDECSSSTQQLSNNFCDNHI